MIYEVVREGLVDARHAAPLTQRIARQSLADGVAQREIHDRGQVRVESVAVLVAALPVCQLRDVARPALAYDIYVGILLAHGPAPLAHRLLLVVGIRVHTQTVQIGIFDPPYGPLLEVLQQVWVVEVHVGHRAVEPAALLYLKIGVRCVGVHVCGEEVVGARILREAVYPVLEGHVAHPPVGAAAVVRDDIHYHLQAAAVALRNERTVQLVRPETRIDMVIVGAGISVIRSVGLVVEQQRRAPYGRCTRRGDVVEVVDHTLYVAAVT